MTTKYFALLTSQGAAKLANAATLGTKLQITEMAVGDGGGTLPTPDAAQTKLIGEKRRASLNALTIDAANSSQIIAEQIIPESEGGFWIREIGLFDADGVLIAVANCAETYKPQLAEGSGRTQTVRMILIVNSTSAVTLKIDPSVVLATRQYVGNAVIEVKAYADKALAAHVAAANPHSQYLQTANALSEIKEAGLVTEALEALALGDGSAVPVGVPLPYPAATAPDGWLKCNGASFSATTYPLLAKVYPSLKLPDLRGEFIRGWDDGRGVDNGRGIGTAQGATSIRTAALDYYGADSTTTNATVGTAFSKADSVTISQPADAQAPANGALGTVLSDNSMVAEQKQSGSVASSQWISVRPRNIAFNYIVRAA
ncbi:phage tail protein [Erwinia sp. BC051422]|uniref:phage tail-collar fiber domain-containing protein n=1 Tax=Erwinia wuhanensis TaxID=3045167 RepID=UPI0026538D27|nr:phage tail protein [Erwinia sp. BC051422]MDN8542015.1 phage tail protein [Erwinia sp. BC051422]